MRLEIGIPNGLKMSSRFCWCCGKLGTKEGSWLICDRHIEGRVMWTVYETPLTRLTDAIAYRSSPA
jgi:hypothetical protein